MRQVLLAAGAIERGDPAAAGMLGSALHTARSQGFLNTVITTAPQVTSYVVEHAAQLRSDPFIERLVAAALEVRATQPGSAPSRRVLAEPLTAAQHRILTLLPTSTYPQIADTLFISCNTVKTDLRSIYQKLGVASRSDALERAVSTCACSEPGRRWGITLGRVTSSPDRSGDYRHPGSGRGHGTRADERRSVA